MPRGRGRKGGISQTATPRRSTTSNTLQRQPTLQTTASALRRSSRLAELGSHQATGNASSTMTDVARRAPFSSPSLGSRRLVERQRQRIRRDRNRTRPELSHVSPDRTPNGPSSNSQSDQNGYVLDFVVTPPPELSIDSPINPAVTLQVRTVRRGPNIDYSLHQYLAVATLVTTDAAGIHSPATPGSLGGPQLADSVHAPDMTVAGSTAPDILGYISFSDLFIRFPGTYRIQVTLMRMGSPGGSQSGGTTLQTVESGVIVVNNS
jgi:hypothetical protein